MRTAGHAEVAPGTYVRLRVADTGLGMEPQVVDRIFEPFFTTKERGRGTGLGLSIIYGIVRAHGGHLNCSSSPGEGTVFEVYLPAAQPDADQTTPSGAAREDAGLAELASGRGERVLVVDDEESIRGLAAETLARAGYRPATAGSGEEALTLLAGAAELPDLVLLDLSMPGMGGFACLREIRARHLGMPVVIATGYADDETVGGLRAGGAAAVLNKPLHLARLLSTVRSTLDARAG